MLVEEKEDTGVKRKKSELGMLKKVTNRDLHKTKIFIEVTESQVIQFVNSVYTVDGFGNPEIYQEESTSTNDIFQLVKENSTVLNNKTLLAFTRWCTGNRLKFLNATSFELPPNFGEKELPFVALGDLSGPSFFWGSKLVKCHRK
ncbi:unnamed protein product [Mucor hiemalis]